MTTQLDYASPQQTVLKRHRQKEVPVVLQANKAEFVSSSVGNVQRHEDFEIFRVGRYC